METFIHVTVTDNR